MSPELKSIALIAVVALVGFGMWWSSKKDDGAKEKAAAEGAAGAGAYAVSIPGYGAEEPHAVLVKFTDFQ